jgi:nitrogen fixation/metabolism regulation signal transduction histidine kinase
MKTVRTQRKNNFITIQGLFLLYLLFCILTILFSHSFISDILQENGVPGILSRIVILTIPAVLLVVLVISVAGLIRDILDHRTGGKFQTRLLSCFVVIVILASAPFTIITIQSVYELLRFWRTIKINTTLQYTQNIALENYAFSLEQFEGLVRNTDFAAFMDGDTGEEGAAFPEGLAAIQDFMLTGEETWTARAFRGDPARKLRFPPGSQWGFVSRELPRDTDTVRYILVPEQGLVRVLSFNLGAGFDETLDAIDSDRARFELIDSRVSNAKPLMIYYYGIFFFPILLITIIIAISFSRSITLPIAELAEATRRVAGGDFSIQIMAWQDDELGLLIRSFNAMVQNLETSRNALVRAEKITVWQNMAQQLAHEIKNPLTPIKLSAERVLRRWRNEPERTGEILESSMLAIIQEVESLSDLLTEFRTLSQPAELSRTWTNLREHIEETITPYRSSHPGIRFDIDHVEAGISIKIEKRYLSQILTNLIINGIDAMNGKGTIEIQTDLVKKRDSRYCRLSIKDTGKGIPEEEGPRIFTPYFTTKESGTGLGLPIVERIANDHGGTIWFNSAEGLGTTFFIDLPLDEGSLSAVEVPETPVERQDRVPPGERPGKNDEYFNN